jgi:hypothetical protein
MSVWRYGIIDLDGAFLGEVNFASNGKWSYPLDGLPQASFTVLLANPIVDTILTKDGDVLLLVYKDAESVPRFVGDLQTMEEVGQGYRRVLTRESLVTRGLSIGDTEQAYEDLAAIQTRGLFEEVIPADVGDAGLRQALVQAHVAVRKQWKEQITFDSKIGAADQPETVAFNFSGPLWRLSKRIWTPSRTSDGAGLENDRGQIFLQLVGDTNNIDDEPTGLHDTGIREGTIAALQHIAWGPVSYKPIAEAFTELANVAVLPFEQPSTWTGSDSFNIAGPTALTGRTADAGGVWTTLNHLNFEVISNICRRPNVADGGEYAILDGLPAWTDAIVQVECSTQSDPNPAEEGVIMAVIARWSGAIPTHNYVMGYIASLNNAAGSHRVGVKKCKAGVVANLFVRDDYALVADQMNTLRLQVSADGHFYLWATTPTATFPSFQASGFDADLKTGGALQQGKIGFADHKQTAGTIYRTYDNFRAAVPTEAFVPRGCDFELAPVVPTTDAYGLKIANLNVSDQLGQDRPHAVFEYGTGVPTNPVFGTDYEVGDIVVGRGKYGTSERFNGSFRIYGIDIEIDEEGKVKETPTLIPQ